jgi:hypothetical protein
MQNIASITPLQKNETTESILLTLIFHSVPPIIQFNSYIQPSLQSLPIKVVVNAFDVWMVELSNIMLCDGVVNRLIVLCLAPILPLVLNNKRLLIM